jgi:hypothetical protein
MVPRNTNNHAHLRTSTAHRELTERLQSMSIWNPAREAEISIRGRQRMGTAKGQPEQKHALTRSALG